MTVTQGLPRDSSSEPQETDFDIVVIGAGFSGMYALYKLRGLGLRLKGFEAGDGPGGTWYWNRYPGARVDIESMIYSYSFDDTLAGVGVARALLAAAGPGGLRQPRRRLVRHPRPDPVRDAGQPAALRRRHVPVARQHRPRRRGDRPLRHRGHRQPERHEHPRLQARGIVRRT